MKKILSMALAALLLLAPVPAAAQYGSRVQLADEVLTDAAVVSTSGATTLSGDISFTANSQSVVIDTKGIGGLSLTVTGTFTATVAVQWSNKSSTGFTAGQVRDINTGVQATTITATGNYSAPSGGRYAKITTTAYTSGTVVVTPVLRSAGYASAGSGTGASFPLTGSCGTVAVSTTCLTLSETWATTGTYVAPLVINVTDSGPANAASLLQDWQVGGVSKLVILKSGAIQNPGAATTVGNSGFGVTLSGGAKDNSDTVSFGWNQGVIEVANTGKFSWSSTSSGAGVVDLALFRDAANTLAQRNGTTAQSSRLYNTYTDASNGEWIELSWASNAATLKPTNNGTGTQRSLTIVTGALTFATLPTCNAAAVGARAFITDSNTAVFLASAAGGGANKVPVVCNNTAWVVGTAEINLIPINDNVSPEWANRALG
jgi:hypothetical protein